MSHRKREAERRKARRLARAWNALRRRAPTRTPLELRLVSGLREHARNHGDTSYSSFRLPSMRRYIAIRIDADSTLYEALDTLIHEYAHALTPHEKRQHGPLWGVAFARCYRIVIGD